MAGAVIFALEFHGGDMNYLKDNPIVLAALIVAAGVIIAAFVYQYNSPYQQCMRQFPETPGFCLKL
jgi:hypothetical protein